MERLETPAQESDCLETPSLLDFPLEIIELICAQLCFHCQGLELPFRGPLAEEERVCRRALAALSATCKTLQGLAQPVLFHRLWRREPFRLDLLRTLSSRPDLAASVEILDQSICGEVVRHRCFEADYPVFAKVSTEDPHFMMTMIRRLGFDTEFFWHGYDREFDSLDCDDDGDDDGLNYRHKGADDDGYNMAHTELLDGYDEREIDYNTMNAEERRQANLADWQQVVTDDSLGDLLPEVLIGLLPNLKSLVYAQGFTYDSRFRLSRFEHMSKQSLFKGLRTLRITDANCHLVIIDKPIRVLLESAPHLETLVISHCELPSRDDGSVQSVPEMPSLRVLQIRHNGTNQSLIETNGLDWLRTLVKACPNLEQFGFIDSAKFWHRDIEFEVNYNPTTDLIKCLAPVSRTLKCLEINLCRLDLLLAISQDRYDNYRESSLEGFSALESVHLSAGACSCGQLSFLGNFSPRWPRDGSDSIPKSERVLDLIGPISQTLKDLTIQANPKSSAWGDVKELLLRMKTGEESFPKLRRIELCPTVLDPSAFDERPIVLGTPLWLDYEHRVFADNIAKAPIEVEELQKFKDEFAEFLVDSVDFEIVPNILDTKRYMHN